MRGLLIAVFVLLLPAMLEAKVLKFALLIGNNRGEPQEIELLYADNDAKKMSSVLRRFGGFRAENITLLTEGSAAEARLALATINQRIRAEIQTNKTDVILFVYYSGHADSENLHLGASQLAIDELQKLVSGSAANFRILILDSCKSGNLTRVKGGRPGPDFDISIQDRLSSQGVALISSSASHEDAQESDIYKGSLFTHYLISGLMGAADASNDGQVSLSEAYQYSYEQTIKYSSRTWAGTQHPTYHYDIKGKGDLILTKLSLERPDLAAFLFLEPGEYLIITEDQNGEVIAEVNSSQAGRKLYLPPGQYFIRRRGPQVMHEGSLTLKPGQQLSVELSNFSAIRYARLVRKGDQDKRFSHGPQLIYRLRGEILDGLGAMHMGGVGYPLVLDWLTITPKFTWGQSAAINSYLGTLTDEYDLLLEATHVIDLKYLSVAIGVELGNACFWQRFNTRGLAPDGSTFAFMFGGVANLAFELPWGFYVQLSAEALSYVLKKKEVSKLETPLTYVFGLALGKYY
jgi:hypothetical protein